MVSCHNGLIHMSFFLQYWDTLVIPFDSTETRCCITSWMIIMSHRTMLSKYIKIPAANTSQQSASVPFLTVHQHQCLQQPIHPITRLAPLRRAFFEVHLGELCTQEVHGNIATLDSSGYCRSARRGPKL